MRLDIDLALLRDNFEQLARTPYFSADLQRYTEGVRGALEHVIANQASLARPVVEELRIIFWVIHKYLAGSVSSESPYEMHFCLSLALREWVSKPVLITTTLSMDRDFHFLRFDLSDYIRKTLPGFASPALDALLVPVALPRLYKHRPVYCAPLYHELGHFVDKEFEITSLSLLLDPPADPKRDGAHRGEHFSDLFAAQYLGATMADTLDQIAGGDKASESHPATQDRIDLINRFLAGSQDDLVDLFQECLHQQQAPALKRRYADVDVATPFDDLRPCRVSSDAELHGLFSATWDYLTQVAGGHRPALAKDHGFAEVDRTVNDLLEKSIRNRSVEARWSDAAS